MIKMPKYHELMQPLLNALEKLGGSGTIDEISSAVIQSLNLPEEITSQVHNEEKSGQTEVEYRLAWARTYLKKYGLIENSERGVWAFTSKYQKGMQINPGEVVKSVRALNKQTKEEKTLPDEPEELQMEMGWKEQLHKTILGLSPDAFERLTKRLLRESGFVQVEVTGSTGDGGIDGKGIVRINGILSYHVVFQCKRYKGSVGPGQIRDFRGAMIGRADKGLFVTTGTFTREAIREATRDGAPPIDLIDGDELAERIKNLRLGVVVKMVEEISLDGEWFQNI